VLSNNTKTLTDQFQQFSSIQCSYINTHHFKWGDLTSYFSEQNKKPEELKSNDLEFSNMVKLSKNKTVYHPATTKNKKSDITGGSGETKSQSTQFFKPS